MMSLHKKVNGGRGCGGGCEAPVPLTSIDAKVREKSTQDQLCQLGVAVLHLLTQLIPCCSLSAKLDDLWVQFSSS
jgi:hypothetical protein